MSLCYSKTSVVGRRRRAAWLAACVAGLLVSACATAPPATTTPQMGRITVGVTTRGNPSDIESMVFVVQIQPRGTSEKIQADAGLYDEDLPPGEYVVRLTRLPKECRVNGVAERRVTVVARKTTAVRFSVTCE
jgi:hypothetical protein